LSGSAARAKAGRSVQGGDRPVQVSSVNDPRDQISRIDAMTALLRDGCQFVRSQRTVEDSVHAHPQPQPRRVTFQRFHVKVVRWWNGDQGDSKRIENGFSIGPACEPAKIPPGLGRQFDMTRRHHSVSSSARLPHHRAKWSYQPPTPRRPPGDRGRTARRS
jgi:hypothetical protein